MILFFNRYRAVASASNGSCCQSNYHLQARQEPRVYPCCGWSSSWELCDGLSLAHHAHNQFSVGTESSALAQLHRSVLRPLCIQTKPRSCHPAPKRLLHFIPRDTRLSINWPGQHKWSAGHHLSLRQAAYFGPRIPLPPILSDDPRCPAPEWCNCGLSGRVRSGVGSQMGQGNFSSVEIGPLIPLRCCISGKGSCYPRGKPPVCSRWSQAGLRAIPWVYSSLAPLISGIQTQGAKRSLPHSWRLRSGLSGISVWSLHVEC